MDIKEYIFLLNDFEEKFEDIYKDALDYHVPIIDKDALNVLKHLIKITKSKKILEVGTAIGYSTLHMLSVSTDVFITTIEKEEASYMKAVKYFKQYQYDNRVEAILKDAKDVNINDLKYKKYDAIFIDASKGNYHLFFDKYRPLLADDGIIIVDNFLVRGLVVDDNIKNKNKLKLKEKVNSFNQYIKKSNYRSSFLNVGDGLIIISK